MRLNSMLVVDADLLAAQITSFACSTDRSALTIRANEHVGTDAVIEINYFGK